MESNAAIDRLSALAQPGRLAVFRLLVRSAPEGVPAGDIALQLGLAPNTLSAQLNILVAANLITGVRDGRLIRYAARPEALSELIVFLMEDCCEGRPDVCRPVQEAAARAACCPPPKAKARRAVRA